MNQNEFPRSKAIVVASGGLDSCVTAAIAASKNELAMLHVRYGQKTQTRELKAFHDVADALKAAHRLVVDLMFFSHIGGSALTDERIPVPSDPPEKKIPDIPVTYVPFRNANILAVAVSWAEVIGAASIYIGINCLDFSGYPDCRPEFIDAFNQVIRLGTRQKKPIRVEAPLITMNKAQIIMTGIRLKAPLDKTWSCYQRGDLACGVCESCRIRLKGFSDAGLSDPIDYV